MHFFDTLWQCNLQYSHVPLQREKHTHQMKREMWTWWTRCEHSLKYFTTSSHFRGSCNQSTNNQSHAVIWRPTGLPWARSHLIQASGAWDLCATWSFGVGSCRPCVAGHDSPCIGTYSQYPGYGGLVPTGSERDVPGAGWGGARPGADVLQPKPSSFTFFYQLRHLPCHKAYT